MKVGDYFQIVTEWYRDFARILLRRHMKRMRLSPGFVAYTLYNIFGVPYRIDDDYLVQGPVRIGKIDLSQIGFYGVGYIRPDFDPDLAGLLISNTLKNLTEFLDQDSLNSAVKGAGKMISKLYDDPSKIKRKLEKDLYYAPHSPQIKIYSERDTLEIVVYYGSPMAFIAELIGSSLAYSIAYARERYYGSYIVDELREANDEYEFVATFYFDRYFHRTLRCYTLMRIFVLGTFYESKSNKAVIYAMNEEGRPYCWRDETGHRPYLLSPLLPEELEKLGVKARFERIKKYYPLMDEGIEVTKVILNDPLSVKRVRERLREYGGAWEANIHYFRNYVYDTGIVPGLRHEYRDGRRVPIVDGKIADIPEEDVDDVRKFEEYAKLLSSPVPEVPRVAMDIEVGAPGEEIPKEPTYPVIAISLVATDGLKQVYLLDRPGARNVKIEGAEVKVYTNEVRMIRDALKTAFKYPVLLTRNGDNFDLPYLAKRLKELGVPDVPIHYRTGGPGYRADLWPIKGTRHEHVPIHVDLLEFFGNEGMRGYVFGGAYDDLRLDTVATALLGEGKVELPTYIADLDAQTLAVYNLKDAELTLRLTTFNSSLVWRLLIMFARIARMGIHDLVRRGISARIDSRFLWEHRRNNRLFPRTEDVLREKGATYTDPKIKGKYRGAIVIDPVPGIHFNVVVLDVASLYPSVIKVRNLSYETINPVVGPEVPVRRIPDTPHFVRVDKKGIVSLLIGLIRDLRVKYFKPKSKDKTLPEEERVFYDAVQSALKVLINASYGVLGFEQFSLYCPPVAEATTALGRFVISKIKRKAEELGAKVIYGDTDSIFITDAPEEIVEELRQWAKDELKVDLEVDKIFRYVVFTERKKNYVGVTPEGNIVIKGMLGKKRNTPEMFKKAFKRALEELSNVNNISEFEKAKRRIKEIIRETIRRLKNYDFDVHELAIRVRLSKDLDKYAVKPPHVKAAELLVKQGIRVRAGSLIEYVHTRTPPGAKPRNMASPEEIDISKYEDLLKSVFEQLIEALGMSFNEILSDASLEDLLGDLL